jgi:hypothetical protein
MDDRSISRQYRWKVKGRLAVLDYAASHSIKPAARFALDRKTIRAWGTRARKAGCSSTTRSSPTARSIASPIARTRS